MHPLRTQQRRIQSLREHLPKLPREIRQILQPKRLPLNMEITSLPKMIQQLLPKVTMLTKEPVTQMLAEKPEIQEKLKMKEKLEEMEPLSLPMKMTKPMTALNPKRVFFDAELFKHIDVVFEGRGSVLRDQFVTNENNQITTGDDTEFFGSARILVKGRLGGKKPAPSQDPKAKPSMFSPVLDFAIGGEIGYEAGETEADWVGRAKISLPDLVIPLLPPNNLFPKGVGPSFTLSAYGTHNLKPDEREFFINPSDNAFGIMVYERSSSLFFQYGLEQPYIENGFEDSSFFRVGSVMPLQKVYGFMKARSLSASLNETDKRKRYYQSAIWA